MRKDPKNRPERLRSATRLTLLMFAIATIVLAMNGKISGDQFLISQGFVFWYFFGTRRKDGTLPEEIKKPE